MRKITEISQGDFDGLLGWFSSDSAEAEKKYLKIREGLIKYFTWRGCPDAELLADETFSRAAVKLPAREKREKFEPESYFYSFAANIFLEDYRERKRLIYNLEELELIPAEDKDAGKNSPAAVCLEKCLAEHPEREKLLLLKYYSFESGSRAQKRQKMAEEHNISLEVLQTRISRLKKILRECLKKCLNREKM